MGGRHLRVSLNPEGPNVIEVNNTLRAAAAAGMLNAERLASNGQPS